VLRSGNVGHHGARVLSEHLRHLVLEGSWTVSDGAEEAQRDERNVDAQILSGRALTKLRRYDEAIELADKVVLLTRRPTKVAEIVDIDLPWPRNLEVTTGEAFMDLKRHCLERFWREVKK